MASLAQRAEAVLEAQQEEFLTPQQVVRRLKLKNTQAAARLADKGLLTCKRTSGNIRQYILASVIAYEDAQDASGSASHPGRCRRSH